MAVLSQTDNTVAMLQMQLANLTKQLEETTNNRVNNTLPIADTAQVASSIDINTLIAEAVAKELKKLGVAPPKKDLTLMEALDLAVDKECIAWYTANTECIKQLPNFIVSEVGKPKVNEFFKLFMETYK
jgi:hypothetical protein